MLDYALPPTFASISKLIDKAERLLKQHRNEEAASLMHLAQVKLLFHIADSLDTLAGLPGSEELDNLVLRLEAIGK